MRRSDGLRAVLKGRVWGNDFPRTANRLQVGVGEGCLSSAGQAIRRPVQVVSEQTRARVEVVLPRRSACMLAQEGGSLGTDGVEHFGPLLVPHLHRPGVPVDQADQDVVLVPGRGRQQ